VPLSLSKGTMMRFDRPQRAWPALSRTFHHIKS
jgi:hypothetical protein